jgi:type I restriction enzyme, S subunit
MPWLSKMNQEWPLIKGKYLFRNEKKLVKEKHNEYPRLALTLNGVVERSKVDSEGLQPTDYSSYQIFNKGNLVFKLIDLENKQTSRVGIAHKDGIMSPAYIRLEKNNKAINEYFAYFYYLSLYYQDVYRDLGKGVRSSLSATELLEIPVPVPPIWVQEKIVKFINYKVLQTLNLKQSLEKQIDNLKEYRSSLITQAVTKGLDPNVPMKDSGIEWLGEVPEHWIISKPKFYCLVNPEALSENTDTDYSFEYVDISSVQRGKGIVSKVKMTFKDAPSRARRIVRKGDIIISSVRTYLKAVASIEEDFTTPIIVSTGFVVLRPNNEILDSSFASYMFEADYFVEQVASHSYGVSYPAISAEELVNQKIILPPVEEQKRIVAYLNEKLFKVEKLIDLLTMQIQKLDEYRSSLITAAVTGQIDVSNWTPTQEEELENIL